MFTTRYPRLRDRLVIPARRATVSASSSNLVSALRRAYGGAQDALETFDRIAGAESPVPDSLEWSVHLRDAGDAGRLTYYFDSARHATSALVAVVARFASLAAHLGVAVPERLQDLFAARVVGSDDVLQVVLGIDERPGVARRVKIYVIMRRSAPVLVNAILGSLDVDRPGQFDPARVYILGVDCGPSGLVDAKLYFRLDPARLSGAVTNLSAVSDLVGTARYMVLQRCLLTDRSQIYFHANSERAIVRHLELRAESEPAARALLERHSSLGAQLAYGRIDPWIISFELRGRRLATSANNVYFHYSE